MRFALLRAELSSHEVFDDNELGEEIRPSVTRVDFDSYDELMGALKNPHYAEGICPCYAVVCSNRLGDFVEDVDAVMHALRDCLT